MSMPNNPSPDAPVTLTLPGAPVTASVTWGQVRSYLVAKGWELRQVGHTSPGVERYVHPGRARANPLGPRPVFVAPRGGHEVMCDAIEGTAETERRSPGEVLASIAGHGDVDTRALERAAVILAAEEERLGATGLHEDAEVMSRACNRLARMVAARVDGMVAAGDAAKGDAP